MLVRRLAALCGVLIVSAPAFAGGTFTGDSRTAHANAVSATGNVNEDHSDTLNDFSPGNQTESINHINHPFYSVIVAANATTSYAPGVYSFDVHTQTDAIAEQTSISSSAFGKFESFSNFHLDATTVCEVSGTTAISNSVLTGTAMQPHGDVILEITDTNTFTDKLFTVLPGSGPFDFTRTLPAGDYYFRLVPSAGVSSSITEDTGSAQSIVNITGTFTIPEPAGLALVAAAAFALPRRAARRKR